MRCPVQGFDTLLPVVSPTVTTNFAFEPVSTVAEYKRQSSLNIYKASGLDDIPNVLLKECAATIAKPLAHVFNLSLQSGCFPPAWKWAKIEPVYKKKGDRSDPKSYRPIALLPCISKVLESLVREQLLVHCLSVNAIPDEQFGFLPKRSTTWQLLSFVDDSERALDAGQSVHACFLDMAKAFDGVNHRLLIHKLGSIGVHGCALTWFESYLTNRRISTQVEGQLSASRKISSGVPQGSVLGSLLFVIFYADLPSVVSATSATYADDTMLYDNNCSAGALVNTQPCCQLADDLVDLSTWAEKWCTSFNASKSANMQFSRRCKGKASDLSLA